MSKQNCVHAKAKILWVLYYLKAAELQIVYSFIGQEGHKIILQYKDTTEFL